MNVGEIHNKLREYKKKGKKLFVSSSFQTHSIPLLHILMESGVDIDVVFINTGFHFPETMIFRDEVTKLLGINLIDIHPLVSKHLQKDVEGQFHFVADPDYCCFLNKTQTMEPYLMQYDVWINGVRADQSSVRKTMKPEQAAPFNTIRFHPMLDWTMKQIHEYKKLHHLPEHPLDKQGYQSIGCVPCTRRIDVSSDRSGRWYGMNKTECGLHTDLISN